MELLKSAPYQNLEPPAEPELLVQDLLKNTFRSLRNLTDPNTGLPIDHNGPESLNLTTLSNIAFYALALGIAPTFDLLPRKIAVENTNRILQHLKTLPQHTGLFPQWIDATTGNIATHWPGSNEPIRPHASSVDNGHLSVTLAILPHLLPETGQLAHDLFQRMDFSTFYNPHNGLLKGVVDFNGNDHNTSHYGALYTEALNASLIGIAKGDIPHEHLYRLAMHQLHLQENRLGQALLSWGGALFEGLVPRLFFDKPLLNHPTWTVSDLNLVESQIRWANRHNNGEWGQSPAGTYIQQNGTPHYSYNELGHPDSLWDNGYYQQVDPFLKYGYETDPVTITVPHSFILALNTTPTAVFDLMRNLHNDKKLSYTSEGYCESFTSAGLQYPGRFSLSQSWIILSLANRLKPGILSKPTAYECSTPLKPLLDNFNPLDPTDIVRRLRPLIPPEELPLLDQWQVQALTPGMPCPPPQLHSLN